MQINIHRLFSTIQRIALLIIACASLSALQAQFTHLSAELVQEHTGDIPVLEGHTTYRVYANFTNTTDVISAIFGDEENPLSITSPTGFYQSAAGGDFGTSINAGVFGFIPELEFDSWLTIGAENSSQAQSGVSQVGMTAALSNFNNQGNLVLDSPNGGSWFVTFGNTNAIAGDDFKILVAQLTVQDSFAGIFNIQAFVNGVQANEELVWQQCLSSNNCAIEGCTDPTNCNYDPQATESNPELCFEDFDNDGVCNEFEVEGCTISIACNFNPDATDDDGSCSFYCPGCTDPQACNYDEGAIQDDGSCALPSDLFGLDYLDCEGECQNDQDGDGICDEAEVPGCQNSLACNYNAEATDAAECEFESCAGCIYEYACNYDAEAVFYDGSCEFGTCPGCTDPAACNFNPTVTEDDGSCTTLDVCGVCGGSGPAEGFNCDGTCVDANANGVCDADEAGCTDATACNYNPAVGQDDGSCTYPDACVDCAGDCLDENLNQICDCDESPGCTDSSACNFDSLANVDDGSCALPPPSFDCDGNCLSDSDSDGICDGLDDCPADPENDADGDGICANAEIPGCTDPTACNFDPSATEEDGSCLLIEVIESEAYDMGWQAGYSESYEEATAEYEQALLEGDYCGTGTFWDPSSNACLPSDCLGDFNGDGLRGSADLLDFLGVYDTYCPGITPPFVTCGDLVTFDGHAYTTVQIGDQCWFAENLRTEHYANGDSIPGNLSNSEWASTTSGAQAIYGEGLSVVVNGSEDEVANLAAFGRLYNWYAANDARGLCPSGWHVPTDGEWMTLEMALGMTSSDANSIGWRGTNQGAQMKSSSSDTPSWNGTNISGFSALPSGLRNYASGDFNNGGHIGYCWSATPFSASNSWSRKLSFDNDDVSRNANSKFHGFSIRCVLD